jgi:hypothetical protein
VPEPPPTKRSTPPPAGTVFAPRDGGMFDLSELLGGMDFGPDSGPRRDAPGSSPPAADMFGDLFEEAGTSTREGTGSFIQSAPPPSMLAALLAELANVNTARARSAWRAKARALAADPSEDWSRAVTRLPGELADAVALRASSSPRASERATLLEWLLQNGARRPKLVAATVALVDLTPKVESVSEWLAQSFLPRVLSDKAAWHRHGAEVLAALASRRAFGEMDQLFTASIGGAGGPAFTAFSSMLLAQVGAAIAERRGKEAAAFAAALASIGFPSRKASAVASLRRKRGAKGDVARLLGVAAARGPKDLPRLEDFIAAVHVLSDAL